MKKTILVIALPFVLTACKQSKEEMLSKKWQAISVDNKQQDAYFTEQEKFLDTFGKSTDAATNIAIYGFSNVDSARESLKAQLKDYRAMQQHAIENTIFDFDPKGTAIMNFSGQMDTVTWSINKEGKLELSEKAKSNEASKITMDILGLTETELKLKFTDNGGTSTVTFKPSVKK